MRSWHVSAGMLVLVVHALKHLCSPLLDTSPLLISWLSAGKMASDNLARLAARMLESVFGNHMRIPPLAPVQAPSAFVSCTRDPLLVAGFYRKLTRCAIFSTSCS